MFGKDVSVPGNGANEGIYIFFVFFNNKIKLAKNSGKEREKLP